MEDANWFGVLISCQLYCVLFQAVGVYGPQNMSVLAGRFKVHQRGGMMMCKFGSAR